MWQKESKNLMVLVSLVSLVGGVMLTGGCIGKEVEAQHQETPVQIIEGITPQEAFTLIQENEDNPDFVIIDMRTPGEFTEEHIEGTINLDYYSETFRDELDKLSKNKTYLIYSLREQRTCCRFTVIEVSKYALLIMEELNFREVYNMLGGINQWEREGFPTTQETP